MGNVLRGVKRKVVIGLVLVLATVGVNVAVASPAMADCSPNSIQLQTYRSADLIVGSARINGCGNSSVRTTVILQWGRWWGWEDLASRTAYGDGSWYGIFWNCTGTGTHTFRTIAVGRTVGGSPYTRVSNETRQTC